MQAQGRRRNGGQEDAFGAPASPGVLLLSQVSSEAAKTTTGEKVRRAFLLVLALACAATLYFSGAFDDPERTVAFIRSAGAWGVLVYLAAFAFLQPFGISGHVFTLAAGAIWGASFGAFGLALLGAVGASCVSFAYARYVAYEWVQKRVPERARKYEKWIVERGLVGMIVFRVLTFTWPPTQLLIGTLRVRFGTMLLGTTLGFAPAIAIDVFLGGRIWAWLVQG